VVTRINHEGRSLARDFRSFRSFVSYTNVTPYDPQLILDLYTTNSTVTQGITSRAPSSPPYSDHHFDVIRHVHSPSYSCSSFGQSS